MAEETPYQPIPYVYRSRGLLCRDEVDQAPEYAYLDNLNCLEREENSMSSRYGTRIINRDPDGTPGGQNYYFTQPITSIARLNYQTSAQRYVGLQDGTLWTRQGDTQGQFTKIYSGLSGEAFNWLINNTFASSQPWLFIYDADAAIKTALGSGTPQLTGIDPSPYTVNTLPYAPLLTMIDSFASGNSYATSGVTGWAYGSVTSLSPFADSTITDFPQFQPAVYSIAGGTTNATASHSSPSVVQSTTYSGFGSVAVPVGDTVTVSFSVSASGTVTGIGNSGTGNVQVLYSVNSGTTWTSAYSIPLSDTQTVNPVAVSLNIPGLTNLDTLFVQVKVQASYGGGLSGSYGTSGTISSIAAAVNAPNAFGPVVNGMISILNTTPATSVPISSIVSSGLSGGKYTTLTITTQTPHGLPNSPWPVGVYASSNDLADGFYNATVVDTTTITVPFTSVAAISATGGTLWFNSTGTPEACVLADLYAKPWPVQMSAWGFYAAVPGSTTSFPVGAWSGSISANSTGTIGATISLDLDQNNQVTDDDLIVLTLKVGTPNNISNIAVQFDVGGSGYTSSYYSKNIAPAYYQANLAGTELAYEATQNQILADTLGLITGAPPNSTTAQLQPGNFSTGAGAWATVYMRRGDFLPVGTAGQSGLDWSNITGWQVVVTTNTNGSSTVAMNGFYLQWGYGPSSYGGIGYDYRITYFNSNTFTESNPTPEQQFSERWGYLSSREKPIFLRQAAQLSAVYSSDPQVTHVRVYRRGGTQSEGWKLIDQIPNITGGGTFYYKDVIADAALLQAQPLELDNDPPVTSTLPNPIATTLSAAVTGAGQSIYSTYSAQIVTVADASAEFVANQVVVVGNADNLEVVRTIFGGTGQFWAILRLQHNAGEPVNVYAKPRQGCNLCALAYEQVWVAGDPNNPHYLYYSKKNRPESFGPQNYIPVSSPDDPIMAVINWRGTLICGTLKTWYIIVGGAQPYAQPTGSQHGIVASQGWTTVEQTIWYRAADGLREFTGANGVYKTLPVEWLYRGNPLAIPPLVDPANAASDVMAYYNNVVYTSYVSLKNSGQRYRLNYDMLYQRFRYDDVPATAMLWEKDTNTLVAGKQIGSGQYALVQDQVGDYDDGGWSGGVLTQTPISMAIQHPYRDLGKPHNPKQWNQVETDVNTQGATMTSTLLFEDGSVTVNLANTVSNSRVKAEMQVNAGAGQQAYRCSIRHTMAVTVAPTLYQEDIHAAVLAGFDSSFDTYWLKPGGDLSVFIKQGYFDYTSTAPIQVSLYADQGNTPYFTFTLPTQTQRAVQRVRFGNVNPAAPAFNCRQWRAIGTCTGVFQLWAKPRVEFKPLGAGNTYQAMELTW